MRGLRLYSAILVAVLFVFFAGIYWPLQNTTSLNKDSALKEQELQDFQTANAYFKRGKYEEALAYISLYQDSINDRAGLQNEWLNLLVKVSEKMMDIPELVLINEHYPEVLKEHEKASLLVAENYLMNGKDKEYEALRNRFIGGETYKNQWAILDVDHLLLQGKYFESYQALESKILSGKEEVLRLIKLALLNAADNPEKALSYLKDANKLDPSDVDVTLYTVRLLENQRNHEAALETYKKAILDNPTSLLLRDQLGVFYIYHEQFDKAIDVWEKGLEVAGDDLMQAEILSKLIVFNKLIHPEKNDWHRYLPLNSPLMPLISYLISLKPDQYVDLTTYSLLPLKNEYLKKEQVLYWLSLLDALKRGDEPLSLKLIHENPFKEISYNARLEFALLQALNYRKTGTLLPLELNFEPSNQPLIEALTKGDQTIDASIEALLKSPEIFSAIFMQFGLIESALQLHKMTVIPEHFPEFVTLDLIHALRQNRGDEIALKFAANQTQTVDIAFLIQELNAREALKAGNHELATRIYESIMNQSFEAKSYLARKAFKENEWDKAKLLTEELLKKYPDHPLLLDNLKKIQEKSG